MKTEELIRAMSADDIKEKPVRNVLPIALAGAAAAAGLAFYATMGIRPDLMAALSQFPVLFKLTFPIMMAVAAFGAVVQLTRPGARLDGWGLALLIAPAVVAASFWATALGTPLSGWASAITGDSVGVCMLFIPLIGTPILFATLFALRRGASTRPRLTGLMAGLLSGSASAAVYAPYCTDDSPMFWGVWYVLAIGVVAVSGALLGPRLLRW